MLMNITAEQIFYIIFFVFEIALIVIIVYYLRLYKKEEQKESIFFKKTKEFEGQLEKIIESEIKNLILELNKKVQNLTNEAVEFYKKEISNFSQTLEREASQLNKFNKEFKIKC
jgi:hypothetical protein